MPRINPVSKGIFKVLAGVALLSAFLTLTFPSAYPDPGLMYAIAQVGIALVFAFLVEAVWLVERVERDDDEYQDGLGITCGFGIAGLTGVAAALMVGGHRAADHANVLDSAGLWWSVSSLALLGVLVVLQPLLVDLHRATSEGESS